MNKWKILLGLIASVVVGAIMTGGITFAFTSGTVFEVVVSIMDYVEIAVAFEIIPSIWRF